MKFLLAHCCLILISLLTKGKHSSKRVSPVFNFVSLYLSVCLFLCNWSTPTLPWSILDFKVFAMFSTTFDNRNNDLFQVYYDSDNIRRDVVAFNPDVKPEVDYLSNSDIL